MTRKRMNKAIAGYHILMILSAVDFKFTVEEDKIIREYLFQEFPFRVNLDREMEVISNLKHDEWYDHFQLCLEDFYDDASESERNDVLKFAVYLAKADNHVSDEESKYLKMLFDAWDYHRE
jgi:hypothetical protein